MIIFCYIKLSYYEGKTFRIVTHEKKKKTYFTLDRNSYPGCPWSGYVLPDFVLACRENVDDSYVPIIRL